MLIGNVGKDPEINYTSSGIPVAMVRLATTETWKDKDGNVQEHTEWHTVVAWRGLAEIMNKIVHRGSRIYVEGKIQNRVFDDKDGNKRYLTEIVAENLLLLDSGRNDGGARGEHRHNDKPAKETQFAQTNEYNSGGYNSNIPQTVTSPDDDIPF